MSMYFNSNRKKEFFGLSGPVDYVAGVGRGATGFTTRSDIGPARDNTDVPDERHHQFRQARDEEENENLNDSNFDEFSGYSGNICARDPYDEDDLEADTIYDNIDKHMEERRKHYIEKRLEIETEEYRRKRPKIQQQFCDLKRQMATVTEEEWMNIPEVGDARNRKQRNPRPEPYLPKPDNLIAMEYSNDRSVGPIDPRMQLSNGFASVNPMENIDLQKVSKARTTLMDCQLKQVSDSVSGQTVIDSEGYLTDLKSLFPQNGMNLSGSEVADMKKARQLLKSVIDSNPKKVEGWVALTRFEESYSKIHESKEIIMKGCSTCPESETMWLEAIRIMQAYGGVNNIEQAKKVAAKALKNVPDSVSLWVAAAELEVQKKSKRAVLRKALENIPDSVKLWVTAINLEDGEEARLLLSGAVQCCPTSVDLWIALAKLSTAEDARKTLNKALEKMPGDKKIWIAACKLQEAEAGVNSEKSVDMLMQRALDFLAVKQIEINRIEWIKDAEEAELCGSVVTARKIIEKVIKIGIDDRDRKHTFLADAESCENHNCYECARAIFAVCAETMPKKKSVWQRIAAFEKLHGTKESYEAMLKRAVENRPTVEVFWLMLAKSKWESGDIDEARRVLNCAFEQNANSEEIMLAAVKLESETNEFERARKLLRKARLSVETGRVWMKSARLEWCLGDLEAAESLLISAVARFPQSPKLWMMLGQLREQRGNMTSAISAFSDGCLANRDCVVLWILRAAAEEKSSINKARNTLEKARVTNGTSAELWLACVRLELRVGNIEMASNLMNRALQCCPSAGLLWSERVALAPKSQKKSKAYDAITKCEHSEHVLLAWAKVFWEHGFHNKVKECLIKTLKAEKLYGDAWAYLYKFESIHGTEESKEDVAERCAMAEPRFGEYWCSISKDVVNWKLKTKDILVMVAQKVPLPI